MLLRLCLFQGTKKRALYTPGQITALAVNGESGNANPDECPNF
jgi:hypothetical protein